MKIDFFFKPIDRLNRKTLISTAFDLYLPSLKISLNANGTL